MYLVAEIHYKSSNPLSRLLNLATGLFKVTFNLAKMLPGKWNIWKKLLKTLYFSSNSELFKQIIKMVQKLAQR